MGVEWGRARISIGDFFSYHLCNCDSVIYEFHMHTYSNKRFLIFFILLTIYLKTYVSVKLMNTILINETSRPLHLINTISLLVEARYLR